MAYKLYNVYRIGEGSGCYAKNYCREFVGQTRAVSASQACNNVRYRNRNRKNPHGGYAESVFGDSLGMGEVVFSYEAVEVDTRRRAK